MDPGLREQLAESDPDEELELLVRLRPGPLPARTRVVTRFGDVATIRLRAGDVPEVYADDAVLSMKPAKEVGVEPATITRPRPATDTVEGVTVRPTDVRRPPGLRETGRGVVVGIIDFGFRLDHPMLRDARGRTRVERLFDMSSEGPSPRPYGYGRVHSRDDIDRALRRGDVEGELGYEVDDRHRPAHGTHVASIAAGTPWRGAPSGIAPGADLVLVELSGAGTSGLRTLGNSVRILEAVDFVFRTAGDRPCVVNASVGAHGGPHDGSTLVERGLDAAVAGRPGRVVCQSTGNYRAQRIHAHTTLRMGQRWCLPWLVARDDPTSNELELWYPGSDEVRAVLVGPDGRTAARVGLGDVADVVVGGRRVGRLYHRRRDPQNGDHVVNAFLNAGAGSGTWRLLVEPVRVADGRAHAWIERDRRQPRSAQSRFPTAAADPTATTGTIANGRGPLTVAAFDPHDRRRPPGHFSSSGPTRDGRAKPDVAAPGVASLAADSRWRTGRPLVRLNGTSMAAPVVTGLVALLLEAAPRALTMREVRALVLGTTRRVPGDDPRRIGHGRVDVRAAVARARRAPAGEASAVRSGAGLGRGDVTADLALPRVAIATRPVPSPPALDAWRDLLTFRPPASVAHAARADVTGVRPHPIAAAWGPVNLDAYTVVIDRLPAGETPASLLGRVRSGLNRFVSRRYAEFRPYNAAAGRRWASSTPAGAVVHIDMYASVGGRRLNVDDGSVVCSQAAPDNWVFSTVWTPGDLGHPVSGNRMFGIVTRGSQHVLFTMAADRLTSLVDVSGALATGGAAFSTADRLWRSLQRSVTRFVHARGGRAAPGPVHSARYDWAEVRRLYGGAPTTVARPRLP